MKKNLLLVAALMAGVCANAQEYVQIQGSALGLTSEVTPLTAGTALGECDAFALSVAFDDSYKLADLKCNNYNKLVIDGTEISTADGIQGNSNPKDVNGANPATTTPPSVPVTGAVLQINTKKDGYIYVWGKLSSHKNYTVFGEGSAIGYQLVMQTPTLGKLDITVQGEGEYNFVMNPIPWPEVIFTGDEASAVKENGLGVIKFFAYADCTYLVNACGSKISVGGAWYDAEGDAVVEIKGTTEDGAEVPAFGLYGSGAGIDNAVVADVVAEEVYTISGQKATAAATGVVLVKKTFADGSVKTVKVIR